MSGKHPGMKILVDTRSISGAGVMFAFSCFHACRVSLVVSHWSLQNDRQVPNRLKEIVSQILGLVQQVIVHAAS